MNVVTLTGVERKRNVATLRRSIRATLKALRTLVGELGKPKSDTWSLASRIEAKAAELKVLQKGLNAIVNHGDEVKILKRATKNVLTRTRTLGEGFGVKVCNYCHHTHPLGVCHVEVTYPAGFGVFREPCGCNL